MEDLEVDSLRHRSNWGKVLDGFGGDAQLLKDAYQNDRTALSIFAALLMTVSYSALAAPPPLDAHPERDTEKTERMQTVYVAFHALAGGASFAAVYVGSFQYIAVNKTPPSLALPTILAMSRGWPWERPIVWLVVSIVSLLCGLCTGVGLAYPDGAMETCVAMCAATGLTAIAVGQQALMRQRRVVQGAGDSDLKQSKSGGAPTVTSGTVRRVAPKLEPGGA